MSAGPSQQYRHYGVQLLDDIHNHFPALLYEPERFSSVADVLSYVRHNVANRFDLFSAGQRTYDGRLLSQPPRGPQASPIGPVRGGFGSARGRGRGRGGAAAATLPRAGIQVEIEGVTSLPRWPAPRAQPAMDVGMDDIQGVAADLLNILNPNSTVPAFSPLSIFSLLNSLNTVNAGAGGGAAAAANFMDPVPVRPTPAQIAEATALETVDAEEEMCAICQDTMEAGSESRVIHYCDHRFHPGCIGTWFQRDVHCPVCRHDIRDTSGGAAAAAVSEAPGQN